MKKIDCDVPINSETLFLALEIVRSRRRCRHLCHSEQQFRLFNRNDIAIIAKVVKIWRKSREETRAAFENMCWIRFSSQTINNAAVFSATKCEAVDDSDVANLHEIIVSAKVSGCLSEGSVEWWIGAEFRETRDARIHFKSNHVKHHCPTAPNAI